MASENNLIMQAPPQRVLSRREQEIEDERAKLPINCSLQWVTAEPVIFFYAFAVGMSTVANADLFIEKTCLEGSVLFGNDTTYPERVCDDIVDDDNRDAEKYVEYQVQRLGYISVSISGLFSIIFSLYAGSWSDYFGRRFLVIFPLLGFLLLNAIALTLSEIDGIPSDYLLFESVQDLTGGFAVLMMGAFAHVSDCSTPKNRTTRMAFLEFVYLLGLDLGVGVSGPIYELAGFSPIYVLSAIVIVTSLLALPFVIERPVHARDPSTGEIVRISMDEEEELVDRSRLVKNKEKFFAFFRFSNVKESLWTGFREREQGRRHILWLLIFCFGCIEIVAEGEAAVDALYVREKFNFSDYDDYADWWLLYYILLMSWGLLALGLMVPVLKQIYHVSDPVIIAIAAVGTIIRCVTFLVADNRDNLYIGGFIDLFNFAGMVACRSAVVSLVDPGEVGKAFGLLSVAQSVATIVGRLYRLIFEEAMDWHLGLVYCINSAIFICVFFIAIYIWNFFRKNRVEIWAQLRHESMTEEQLEKTTERLQRVTSQESRDMAMAHVH